MTDTNDEEKELIESLLAASPAEREVLLRAADAAALGAALGALGHRREIAAAEVLAQVDQAVEDRALRKAARRELHRLRSMGIEPPPPSVTTVAGAEQSQPSASRTVPISDAWVTDIDPSGARALWLVGDRPLGGIWFAALLLNDQRGLQELNLVDSTRKRFERDFNESRRGEGLWISLPGEYALKLVREAIDLTRESGSGLPTRYQAFREVFGEAAGPPERALAYETVSPAEVNFNPGWLQESPRLLGEREVGRWYVPVPSELRSRALEVARSPGAGLLVPGRTPEQQALQLVGDASRQALTPALRRAFQRRLEETAQLFLATDRPNLARLAVAAARALEDGGIPPERHPLMRLFLAAGLARLVGGETIGSRRAPDVLLELVERAAQQEAQSGQVETRPSGLILPR